MLNSILKRLGFFVACALLPTFMIGFLIAVSNFRSLMLREKPAALSLPSPLPSVQFHPGARLKAAILVGNEGTELTDLLGPYAVLAESGALDVYTVAPRREASPLGSTLAILPDFSFKDAPQADVLVIPPIFDGASPEVLSWVKAQASKAKLVLAVCEGARLAAQAGLLDGARATSHILSLPELRQSASQVNWIGSGPRVVVESGPENHSKITTAGVTASLEGAREAVELLSGANSEASRRASQLIASRALSSSREEFSLHARDSFSLFFRAAFDWARPIRAVWIGPGASEIQLAAMLDLLPRSLSVHVTTLGETRAPIRTRRGLWVIPLEETRMAGPAHSLLLAGGTANAEVARAWAKKFGAEVQDWSTVSESDSFAHALTQIGAHDGARLANLIAHLVEWPLPLSTPIAPWPSGSLPIPLRLFWPPLALMTLGVLFGNWLGNRLRKRFSRAA